jgi:para-aminobenzoate synthetase component 1
MDRVLSDASHAGLQIGKRVLEIEHDRPGLAACLRWADASYPHVCLLDSNTEGRPPAGEAPPAYYHYDWVLAVGRSAVELPNTTAWAEGLKAALRSAPAPLFGHLRYDLGRVLMQWEGYHHYRPDGRSLGCFFSPEVLITSGAGVLRVEAAQPDAVLEALRRGEAAALPALRRSENARVHWFDRRHYLETVERIREHIYEGDVYELNLCRPIDVYGLEASPLALYARLREASPNPFGALLKQGGQYVLSASMERYLRRAGAQVLSQPIKGTARRAPGAEADRQAAEELARCEKERAENLMIVDLVRNDLSYACRPGSVEVPELCRVYSFPHVHQMISTVEGSLRPDCGSLDLLRYSFPMGSMTGAPKRRVTQLIDRYEGFARGVYSGSIGYIGPDAIDLNVVIRSLLYQPRQGWARIPVGSAITYDAAPEREYEECINKVSFLVSMLTGEDVHAP